MSRITSCDSRTDHREQGDNVRVRVRPLENRVKFKTFAGLSLVLGLVVAAVPVSAHHSFAAEFDGNKQINLIGVVTRWIG